MQNFLLKSLFILSFLVLTSQNTAAQNTPQHTHIRLGADAIQTNATIENLALNDGCFSLLDDEKPGVILTSVIKTQLDSIDPFLLFFVSAETDAPFDKGFELYVRVQFKNGSFGQWEPYAIDPHALPDDQPKGSYGFKFNTGYYGDDVAAFQLKFAISHPQLKLRQIDIHFFTFVGIDFDSDKQTELTNPESCPCAAPNFIDRTTWSVGNVAENLPVPDTTNTTHLVVHHQGQNGSIMPPFAAVVYSIWIYHTTPAPNGANFADIGYNWLIDPNGVLYKGRAWAGNNQNVVGAHMCACNGNKMGVCLLGNFMNQLPQVQAYGTLVQLLGWKSCEQNINAAAASLTSYNPTNTGCSPGIIDHIIGHRQGCSTGYTACPGDAFFPFVNGLKADVAQYVDQCGSSASVCQNNTPCTAQLVAINPDNICAPTACATNLATPTLPPVPFLGDAQCTSLYQNTRADDDVWFTIVPDTNTTVVIDVNPTGNMAYFDPVVGLYEGTCNNLVQVHCADNAASGMAETLHFVPVPNTTYYVRVFSYGMHAAHQGPFDMCVKYVANFGVDVTHLLQNIVVYPNPNAGHFTVDLGKHQSAISYHITDMLGREILRGEARDCSQFDLHTSLATGVYTLTIQSASWHAVRRVVVK